MRNLSLEVLEKRTLLAGAEIEVEGESHHSTFKENFINFFHKLEKLTGEIKEEARDFRNAAKCFVKAMKVEAKDVELPENLSVEELADFVSDISHFSGSIFEHAHDCARDHDFSVQDITEIFSDLSDLREQISNARVNPVEIINFIDKKVRDLTTVKTLGELKAGLNRVEDVAYTLISKIDKNTSVEDLDATVEAVKSKIEYVFETALDENNPDFSLDDLTFEQFRDEVDEFLNGEESTHNKIKLAYELALKRISAAQSENLFEKAKRKTSDFFHKLSEKINTKVEQNRSASFSESTVGDEGVVHVEL